MRAHDLDVDGYNVRVWEALPAKPSTRPTVVFLHGMADDGRCLAAFASDVTSMGFRILLPDAPAHGHSALTPAFTADSRAASAIAAITSLTEAPVVLGGHSMGGETAALVAAQRPDLVSGLVLEEPTLFFAPVSSALRRRTATEIRTWIEGLQSSSHAERVEWVRNDGPLWNEKEYAPWARAKALTNTGLFDGEYGWLENDGGDVVSQISVPTLLIRGEPSSHGMAAKNAKGLLLRVPQAIDLMIPGAGHCVRRDNPLAYRSAIAGFLTQFAYWLIR
jgi:pimeloyl-ACP methyl ester carboxylesterase